MEIVRLRIHADVNDRRPDDSIDVRLDADLSDGTSVLLLDDRGWTTSAGIAGTTAASSSRCRARSSSAIGCVGS